MPVLVGLVLGSCRWYVGRERGYVEGGDLCCCGIVLSCCRKFGVWEVGLLVDDGELCRCSAVCCCWSAEYCYRRFVVMGGELVGEWLLVEGWYRYGTECWERYSFLSDLWFLGWWMELVIGKV